MAYCVESVFDHAGLTCVVILNGMGHRCGYVGVPESHPLYKAEYYDIEDYIDVHGGLTFSGDDPEYPISTKEDLWWLGFDCAHVGDAFDYDAVEKEIGEALDERFRMPQYEGDTIKDQEYVEKECRKLAEQLSKYESKHRRNE